jgi:hypothetical protein
VAWLCPVGFSRLTRRTISRPVMWLFADEGVARGASLRG